MLTNWCRSRTFCAEVKETDRVGCICLLQLAVFHDLLPVGGGDFDNFVGRLLVNLLVFLFARIASPEHVLAWFEHFESTLLRKREWFFFLALGRFDDLELSWVSWVEPFGLVSSFRGHLLPVASLVCHSCFFLALQLSAGVVVVEKYICLGHELRQDGEQTLLLFVNLS